MEVNIYEGINRFRLLEHTNRYWLYITYCVEDNRIFRVELHHKSKINSLILYENMYDRLKFSNPSRGDVGTFLRKLHKYPTRVLDGN